MNYCVTGGCGFIGSHLVDRLIEDGHAVTILDDFSTGQRANLNPAARLIEGSILDATKVREALSGADAVFHTAAWARVVRSVEDPLGTHAVNVTGTLQVLQMAREQGIKRFVYSSSSSVVGDQDTHVVREDMACRPVSPYALQKYMGEQYVDMFARLFGMSAVSLRYFNVYGPRQLTEGAYALVIGKFMRQKREGEPMSIYGDGEQTRAYTYVADVVEANLKAARVALEPGEHLVVNIGTAVETSVNAVAERIGGEVTRIVPNPRGHLEELRKVADNARARERLGWTPKVSFEEGMNIVLREEEVVAR
jgi:UDP-glucose 4-epimerase